MTTLIQRDELVAEFLSAGVAEAVWGSDSDNERGARRLTRDAR